MLSNITFKHTLHLLICFGSLTSFNIRGHIATVPSCSIGILTDHTATLEYPAADTGHGTPPRHSIQTRGRHILLSIDVERYPGIHNYPF